MELICTLHISHKGEQKNFLPLSSDDSNVKKPTLLILDGVDIQKLPLFGEKEGLEYFWFYDDWKGFEYAELLKATIGCHFHFKSFPFDRHTCYLKFFSPNFDTNTLAFFDLNLYEQGSKARAVISCNTVACQKHV